MTRVLAPLATHRPHFYEVDRHENIHKLCIEVVSRVLLRQEVSQGSHSKEVWPIAEVKVLQGELEVLQARLWL